MAATTVAESFVVINFYACPVCSDAMAGTTTITGIYMRGTFALSILIVMTSDAIACIDFGMIKQSASKL